MIIEYDPAKNEKNIQERSLSFELACEFEFETAFYQIDDRKDYGEVRYRALGHISNRLHALVFVETTDGIRVISLRKGNKREERRYEQETA